MIYKEQQCDLFTFEGKRDLVHCISADYRMGAGIAKEFTKRGVKERLQNYYRFKSWIGKGFALPVSVETGRTWNLITKEFYWEKPTYKALVEALEDMKSQIMNCETGLYNKQIAMPKIGCGLDRLDWNAVQPIIQTVFEDTDIDIVVCYL